MSQNGMGRFGIQKNPKNPRGFFPLIVKPVTIYYNRGMRNKKGFTLIELLLVIAVIGFLGVAAITSYINSTATFNFLSSYKSVVSSMRTARSYAITNKDSSEAERYGVLLEDDKITVFADNGQNPFEFDEEEEGDLIVYNKTHDFSETSYRMKPIEVGFPLYFFYELGSGDLMTYSNGTFIPKTDLKYITVIFYEENSDLERFIVVFQVSGLTEGFEQLPE
ncbi:prepilin-type N-terminal cleavage/methylation domain-containing protein [Candidatus Peregrinibacteria bacterium]|nr:prepilin-type N-terminal cleavage/methylation domain-containing protein [Candidatus Peregrinibacteria bacterium]